MKKILVAAIVLFFAGASANAQTKDHKQKDHKDKMEHLGLTDEQKAEMKRIHEAEKNELEALKKNDKLTKEEAIEARKAIQEKYRTQFKNVLTEEQQKKTADLRDHNGDHEMKHDTTRHLKAAGPKNAKAVHKDMGQKNGKDKIETELQLSDDQKNRIAKSREAFKAQADAIKKDEKLTREQKQEALKSLTEKQKEEFKLILTEEQRQKLESNRKGQPKKGK
jgi:hypothetical protein